MVVSRSKTKAIIAIIYVKLFLALVVDAVQVGVPPRGVQEGPDQNQAGQAPVPGGPRDSSPGASPRVSPSGIRRARPAGPPQPNADKEWQMASLSRIEEKIVDRPKPFLKDFFAKRSGVERIYIDSMIAPAFPDGGVSLICVNLPKLKVLSLKGCCEITDASLNFISKKLKELRRLNLEDCCKITPSGIKYIKSIKSLKYLNLDGCIKISQENVRELIASLEELELIVYPDGDQTDPQGGAFKVSRDGVCTLKCLPSSMSEAQLNGLFRSGPSVSQLVFAPEITTPLNDLDLKHIGECLKKLEELSLSDCSQITTTGMEALTGCKLKSLELHRCPNLDATSLWDLVSALSSTLEHISLDDKDGQHFESSPTLEEKASNLHKSQRKVNFEQRGSTYLPIGDPSKRQYRLGFHPTQYPAVSPKDKEKVLEQIEWTRELVIPKNFLEGFVRLHRGDHASLRKALEGLSYIKVEVAASTGSSSSDLSEEERKAEEERKLKEKTDLSDLMALAQSLPKLELFTLYNGLHVDPQKGFCVTPDGCCEFSRLPSTFNERQLKGIQRVQSEIKSVKWNEVLQGEVKDADLAWIVEQINGIEQLSLPNAQHLSQQGTQVFEKLPGLKELRLTQCANLTHRQLSDLMDSLPRSLQFSVQDKDGRTYTSKQAFVQKRIEELKAGRSDFFKREDDRFCLLKPPSLLSSSEKRFFDEQAPHVERLSLASDVNLSDEDVALFGAFKALKEVDFAYHARDDAQSSNQEARISAEAWKQLGNLKSLERIHLHKYPSEALQEMRALAHELPNLEYLQLPDGNLVGFEEAFWTEGERLCFKKRPSQLAQNQRQGLRLCKGKTKQIDFNQEVEKSLMLAFSPSDYVGGVYVQEQIVDEDLSILADSLPELQRFHLRDASGLTSQGLAQLKKFKQLSSLELLNAKKLTPEAFLDLVDALPQLANINLDDGRNGLGLTSDKDHLRRRVALNKVKQMRKAFIETGSEFFKLNQNAGPRFGAFKLIKRPSVLSDEEQKTLKTQAGWVTTLEIEPSLLAQFEDADWRFLEHFQGLQSLWINDNQNPNSNVIIPESAIATIKALPAIRSVKLPEGDPLNLSEEAFDLGTAMFTENSKRCDLKLGPSALTASQILQLASVEDAVTEVELTRNACKDFSVSDISALRNILPELGLLILEDCQDIGTAEIQALTRLNRLDRLGLEELPIGLLRNLFDEEALMQQLDFLYAKVKSVSGLLGSGEQKAEFLLNDFWKVQRFKEKGSDLFSKDTDGYTLKKRLTSLSDLERRALMRDGLWIEKLSIDSDLKEAFSNEELKTITQAAANLKNLNLGWCSGLTSLDVTALTALQSLYLYGCSGLTSLDVTALTALQSLHLGWCSGLTSLDVTALTALQSLYLALCSGLTSLDVTALTALQFLDLGSCSGLTSLDVTALTALQSLYLRYCSGLSEEAVQAIKKQLPKCPIYN